MTLTFCVSDACFVGSEWHGITCSDNNYGYPPRIAGGLPEFDSSGNAKPPSFEPLKTQADRGFR